MAKTFSNEAGTQKLLHWNSIIKDLIQRLDGELETLSEGEDKLRAVQREKILVKDDIRTLKEVWAPEQSMLGGKCYLSFP